jgi:hydroxypyruvate isomerase
MRKCFLPFEPLIDRRCKLLLRGKCRDITLISTYAPTEDGLNAIKDAFFDQLSRESEKTRKYDILILLGNLNTKIVRENVIAIIEGKYTLHEVIVKMGNDWDSLQPDII